MPVRRDRWRGPSQWTSTLNSDGDRVGIYVGNPDLLWLYIRSEWGADRTSERAARMRRYSWAIQQTMGDQQLGENLERNADDGRASRFSALGFATTRTNGRKWRCGSRNSRRG